MLKDECEHCRLVQSRQFVAKVHQNAPNCEVLQTFRLPYWWLCPQTPVEWKQGKGMEGKG